MKKSFFVLGMLLCIILSACGEDDSAQTAYTELNVVTGLDIVDENGMPLGQWKSPNHNPGEIFAFPNPNAGFVFVSSDQKIVRIWLIPADCVTDNTTTDIPGLSANLSYEIAALENAQIKNIPLTDFNLSIILDLSDVAAGFYRMFFELESGALFWENLYIDPSSTNTPTFEFLDGLCD